MQPRELLLQPRLELQLEVVGVICLIVGLGVCVSDNIYFVSL